MIEVKIPELAESITEGTIAEWLKNVGDSVAQGEAVLLLETDKVNIEVTADGSGVLQEILKQPGDTVKVGETVALLQEGAEATQAPALQEAGPTPSPEAGKEAQGEDVLAAGEKREPAPEAPPADGMAPVASPAARRLARERGIDLSHVRGSDPLGRITPKDVQKYSPLPVATPPPQVQKEAPASAADSVEGDPAKPVERQRMSRRRLTIANRLVEAQHNAAMLTTFNEVDMTAILEVRNRRKEAFFDQYGVKLGFMSFFTKAVVGGLKAYPLLNAEIQGEDILVKKYYDIGIAVATDAGLVVPVVREADRKSFAEIERDIADLAEKARTNTLELKDLQGGTFTITNGGVFGSLLSTPILNAPQVGILGMHKIQKRPVAVGDNIALRPMMYIALSYDHRLVDGKEAVSFLVKVKELLEDPESLLLEG